MPHTLPVPLSYSLHIFEPLITSLSIPLDKSSPDLSNPSDFTSIGTLTHRHVPAEDSAVIPTRFTHQSHYRDSLSPFLNPNFSFLLSLLYTLIILTGRKPHKFITSFLNKNWFGKIFVLDHS